MDKNSLNKIKKISGSILFYGDNALVDDFIFYLIKKELRTNNLNQNPDFMIIQPKKNEITLNEIKKANDFLKKKPVIYSKKILYIKQADKLNKSSSNAILKSIEENTSDKKVVILSAKNKEDIQNTILSRVIKIKLDSENLNLLLSSKDELKTLFYFFFGSDLKKIKATEKLLKDEFLLEKSYLFLSDLISLKLKIKDIKNKNFLKEIGILAERLNLQDIVFTLDKFINFMYKINKLNINKKIAFKSFALNL